MSRESEENTSAMKSDRGASTMHQQASSTGHPNSKLLGVEIAAVGVSVHIHQCTLDSTEANLRDGNGSWWRLSGCASRLRPAHKRDQASTSPCEVEP